MILKLILAPVLGGVIGYITNDLAIRMLFRPRKAVYIGKLHVPFTPGLIPQQKERIAASIGAVVSRELLDSATLEQTLLSDAVLSAVRQKIDDIFRDVKAEGRPLRDKLTDYLGKERVQRYEREARVKGADFLSEKLVTADAGGTVMRAAMNALKEKQGLGLLTVFMDDGMTQHLGGKINRLIEQNGPEFLEQEIGRLADGVLEQPVGVLYAKYEDKAKQLKERLVELYRFAVEQKLQEVLALVNVEQVVVEKINAFSAEELENLIFSVMKKELRAIVYLGALLGFLMGFLNLLW